MKIEEELRLIVEKLRENRANKCIRCGETSRLQKGRPSVVICLNKACKYRYYIWQDIIFKSRHINEMLVLKVLDLFMQNFLIKQISYVTGLSRSTIWKVLKSCSKMLVPKYYKSMDEIGGMGVVVEVDESKFGKRKYNKGHSVDGVWVLGMIERTGLKRIKLIVVDDRSSDTLDNELIKGVNLNSTIYSDKWAGYNNVSFTFAGHGTVNHSKNFKDPVSGVHTNTIEGSWSGIKINVPFRGRTKTKISLYLVRYMIAKNEIGHPLDIILKYLF